MLFSFYWFYVGSTVRSIKSNYIYLRDTSFLPDKRLAYMKNSTKASSYLIQNHESFFSHPKINKTQFYPLGGENVRLLKAQSHAAIPEKKKVR